MVLTYSAPIDALSVTSQTVAVHSMMQGLVVATHSTDGEVVTVDPTRQFFPGELVYTTATTQTTDITGTHPVGSTVWQFQAGAPAGHGRFSDTVVEFGGATDRKRSVAWGDFDGDGDLDLVAGHWAGEIVLYENDGHGALGSPNDIGNGAGDVRSLIPGDYNGDGNLDLAAGVYSGQNAIYPGNGDGTFGDAVFFGTGSDQTISMACGDIDGGRRSRSDSQRSSSTKPCLPQ